MRDFLQDIKIIGTVLVSRERDILYYTIPNLLKWCDWVLIMLDNEDRFTRQIVEGYKRHFPDRIRIASTNIEGTTKEQEKGNPKILWKRFYPQQGKIRNTILEYLHRCVKRGEKIDIILWPDGDEVFSDYLPPLLEEFWALKEKKVIAMKPVDVFGDFQTIRGKSMSAHIRILKYGPDWTAIPYRTLCNYMPHQKSERMARTRITVHLAYLTVGKRQFRKKSWRTTIPLDEPLYCLSRDVRTMSMPEIREEEKKGSCMTVKEYLKKHNLKI